jgi:hypothetical protein
MVTAGMEGVVVNAEALFYLGKEKIAKLALARGLPTCSPSEISISFRICGSIPDALNAICD